jgi:hypothetical protein
MAEGTDQPSSVGNLGSLSLVASLLGSALAATMYPILTSQVHIEMGVEEIAFLPLGIVITFFFGIFIAVPAGLTLGIPMIAISRPLLGHVAISTSAFATVGLVGGLVLKHLGGIDGLRNAELIFGACVGGMHPLVYARANGVAWHKIVRALLIGAAVVPSLAYAWDDVGNLLSSRAEFETRCANHYGAMAFFADRAALERRGGPVNQEGTWHNERQWRSLYKREDRVPIDKAHVLIARDYAYVPGGFAGWITGGRRVERHCLSEKEGSTPDMLRHRAFGRRPSLQDLTD